MTQPRPRARGTGSHRGGGRGRPPRGVPPPSKCRASTATIRGRVTGRARQWGRPPAARGWACPPSGAPRRPTRRTRTNGGGQARRGKGVGGTRRGRDHPHLGHTPPSPPPPTAAAASPHRAAAARIPRRLLGCGRERRAYRPAAAAAVANSLVAAKGRGGGRRRAGDPRVSSTRRTSDAAVGVLIAGQATINTRAAAVAV